MDYQEILSQIVMRDHRDASRSVGPLAVPKDAETVDTTVMTQDQVIEHIVSRARTAVPSVGEAR